MDMKEFERRVLAEAKARPGRALVIEHRPDRPDDENAKRLAAALALRAAGRLEGDEPTELNEDGERIIRGVFIAR